MGPRTENLVAQVAVAIQGPFLAYLSRRPPSGLFVFTLTSFALAAAMGACMAERPGGGAAGACLEFALGSLGMLAGLYADGGFRPLVGGGLCLCGCPGSLTGVGLVSRFRWTQALMLGACAAATLSGRQAGEPGPLLWAAARTLLSTLLMFAGMAAMGWIAGRIQILDPARALVASFLAMAAGMAAGSACARSVAARGPAPFCPAPRGRETAFRDAAKAYEP